MTNGQRYTPEEIDKMLDDQVDKLGNVTLARAHLEGLGILATLETVQEDPWQHDWVPTSPQELHAAKFGSDTKNGFAHKGISIRAKRAKFEHIKGLRATALRDKTALQDAEIIDDFCEPNAMDAIERHIAGAELVKELRSNPDRHFSATDLQEYIIRAKQIIANLPDDEEFMVYAHEAQNSHNIRFAYWLALTSKLEDTYPYLKQIQ